MCSRRALGTGREFCLLERLSELAESFRFGFAELVASCDIPRHYIDEELTQDPGYARHLSTVFS